MLDPKHVKPGATIELRDEETLSWIPLTIASVTGEDVECRTLAGKPILTTIAALVADARLRPRDGSCADCGYDAHDGPCVERVCSECGAEVASRCSQHPYGAVNVYRRKRYLAEVVEDKPFPTREASEPLRRNLLEQMRVLRGAEQPRASRVVITAVERAEMLSALEDAVALIGLLPTERRRPT